jgi:hypothetical protein
MVGGPWLTTAAGVGSPMFPSPLGSSSGGCSGIGVGRGVVGVTGRHTGRLGGSGGRRRPHLASRGQVGRRWWLGVWHVRRRFRSGVNVGVWGDRVSAGECWAGLSTEDLLLAMSAAPVLASPQPATFTATGGCAPVTGHTHVYRGGAEGVGLAPGACVDVDVGNGGVRGGAGGRVASPVDVSGDDIKRIGVDDSCDAVTLDSGTLAPTGLRVQGGCGADTDALEGTRAVDQMHVRVRPGVRGWQSGEVAVGGPAAGDVSALFQQGGGPRVVYQCLGYPVAVRTVCVGVVR